MLTIRITALRPLAVALMAGFLIIACAGVPGTTQQPGTTAQPGPASPGTSPDATPPAATSLPGGGVDLQDPCGLATIEEVSTALGTQAVQVEPLTGDTTTYCNYRAADGTLLLATSFSRGQTFVFDSFANSSDAIPVPGVGEAAVISSGTLIIKQGDAVVGIQPSAQIGTPEELLDALSNLARAVADRL